MKKQAAAPGRMLVADDLPMTAMRARTPDAVSSRSSDAQNYNMTGPPPPMSAVTPVHHAPSAPVLAGAAAASYLLPRGEASGSDQGRSDPTANMLRTHPIARGRKAPPSLLDQKLWGVRISTAIAFVAAFVLAVVLLILFVSR